MSTALLFGDCCCGDDTCTPEVKRITALKFYQGFRKLESNAFSNLRWLTKTIDYVVTGGSPSNYHAVIAVNRYNGQVQFTETGSPPAAGIGYLEGGGWDTITPGDTGWNAFYDGGGGFTVDATVTISNAYPLTDFQDDINTLLAEIAFTDLTWGDDCEVFWQDEWATANYTEFYSAELLERLWPTGLTSTLQGYGAPATPVIDSTTVLSPFDPFSVSVSHNKFLPRSISESSKSAVWWEGRYCQNNETTHRENAATVSMENNCETHSTALIEKCGGSLVLEILPPDFVLPDEFSDDWVSITICRNSELTEFADCPCLSLTTTTTGGQLILVTASSSDLFQILVAIPANAYRVEVKTYRTKFSPTPFPSSNIPVYLRFTANPTLITYDHKTYGSMTLQTPVGSADFTMGALGSSWHFAIGNETAGAIHLNVRIKIWTQCA